METAEAGLFCAFLNIAQRKPGLMFTRSLGHQLLLVTHWKPLGLPLKLKQQLDQKRGGKKVLWVEGGRTLKPGHPGKGHLGLALGVKAARHVAQ